MNTTSRTASPRPRAEVTLVATPANAVATEAPHILLVVDQLAETLGGGERVLQKLARLLPKHGFRVSVLTLALHPNSPFLHDVPCPVYLLPLGRTWDATAMRAAKHLRSFVRQQRVGIVQTFFESSDLWVGTVVRTIPGIKLIWSRRDMGILRAPKHRLAYRLLRRLPHAVFAVSEGVRQHVIHADGVEPDRVQTIYNGVDLAGSQTDRSAPSGTAVRIVSVGNLRPVKGFDVLLEAAVEVCRRFPETVFQIAGKTLDRQYANTLQQRIQELGLSSNFLLLGDVSDIPSFLQQAAIFVLPSRSEGFSNAIVEAMAQGLPVVATAVGGNAEAVDDGTTGRIVAPEDPVPLAHALCDLLNDALLRQKMGLAGRLRAENLFSTERMVSASVESYRGLLKTVTEHA